MLNHLKNDLKTNSNTPDFKKIEEKREDVYYRIKNLLDHGILTLNQDLDKGMCINHDLKEDIIKILDSTKSSIKKNIINN